MKCIQTDLQVPELDRDWNSKRCKISKATRAKIFKKFSLDLVIDCTDEMLLSRVLSCYYGMDCYEYEKDGTHGEWIFSEAYKNALKFADDWLRKPEPVLELLLD